jgi:D-arabinose 5-phosphate isomerase GutQ
MRDSTASVIAEGRHAPSIEAASVGVLEERIDEEFVRAWRMVADASGRTVVCGIGKSGHVESPLASDATVILDCAAAEEARPMDPVPISSATDAARSGRWSCCGSRAFRSMTSPSYIPVEHWEPSSQSV